MHAEGDAVVILYADFQDPPELIPTMIAQWEAGRKVVPLVRIGSEEGPVMRAARRLYYYLLKITSGLNVIANYSGTGCYDRSFVNLCKAKMDQLFVMRQFVARHGHDIGRVEFIQPLRKGGTSSMSLGGLFRTASEHLTQNFSKRIPLLMLLASIVGVVGSTLVGAGVLVRKLLHWDKVSSGVTPLLLVLLANLFIQNIFWAMNWIWVYEVESVVHRDAPPLDPGRNQVIVWSLRLARAAKTAFERHDTLIALFGYLGTLTTLAIAIYYLIAKLIHWDDFSVGIVPALLIVSLSVGMQCSIGSVLVVTMRRSSWMLLQSREPLVRMEKTLNFDR
jgi:hypothetical protein